MEKIKSNLNLIIGGLTFLFIGFIIYNTFIKEDSSSDIEEVIVTNEDSETREILDVLDKIEKIKIDKKFFLEKISDDGYVPSFSDLIDYQTKGEEERPGKVNPFMNGAGMIYNDTEGGVTEGDEKVNQEVVDKLNSLSSEN